MDSVEHSDKLPVISEHNIHITVLEALYIGDYAKIKIWLITIV